MQTIIGKNQKGFTLTELLVAMGLSLVVLGAVASVFRVQSHTVKAQEFKMEAQEDARAALDMMTREIRNAGFFPGGVACADIANTAGIVSANTTPTSIQFVYDFRGAAAASPADGDCGDPGENITYNFTGNIATSTPGDITRDVHDGNGPQPLTAGNVTSLTLTYFDATGPTGALITVPASIAPLAKRISISLTVQSRSTDVQFGGLQNITMTSNVDLRNRCIPGPCTQM